jgi:hypothetical protein
MTCVADYIYRVGRRRGQADARLRESVAHSSHIDQFEGPSRDRHSTGENVD